MLVGKLYAGRLTHDGRHARHIRALNAFSLMHGIDFFIFSLSGVNTETKTIMGHFWDCETQRYVVKETRYPDVFDGSMYVAPEEYRKARKDLFANSVPFFSQLSFKNKSDCQKLLATFVSPEMLIRNCRYNSDERDEFIKSRGVVFLKPNSKLKGKGCGILMYENGNYLLHTGSGKQNFTADEFAKFGDANFKEQNILVQEYVDSTTKEGVPFDVRVRCVREGADKWRVWTLARIGASGGVASNLSAGGECQILIKLFLAKQFGEQEGERIHNELVEFSKTFPQQLQKAWESKHAGRKLCIFGADVGINRVDNNRLKIFEINGNPNYVRGFEEVDAEARVKTYKWLCEEARKK